MTNLQILCGNLESIQREIQTKIIPENIKSGVTIFGITGTYTGENTEEETPEE